MSHWISFSSFQSNPSAHIFDLIWCLSLEFSFTHVCWRTRNCLVTENCSCEQSQRLTSKINRLIFQHDFDLSSQEHDVEIMHVITDTIWACLYPIFTHSSSANWKSRLCVSMAIRVFSLCENWRRVMTAASLCWHCQAIAFCTS